MSKETTNVSINTTDAASKTAGSILPSKYEVKIDPRAFKGEWLKHSPTTSKQREAIQLFKRNKANGLLHSFTCMGVDPSIKDGKLVYEVELPPAVGISYADWEKLCKNYSPLRNSRVMTSHEFVYRNLSLIPRLLAKGCDLEKAWGMVFDDSKELSLLHESFSVKPALTGSKGLDEFHDLGNTSKLLAPAAEATDAVFWIGCNNCNFNGVNASISALSKITAESFKTRAQAYPGSVAALAMD